MLSIIKSMGLNGLEGYLVDVQVDVSAGLPAWEIVGLPDASVKEAKERVKTAIKNSGFDFQSKRIVVNLAPANTKKEGSIYDLPIAIGILDAMENIQNNNLEKCLFLGELSLDGSLNKINGVLPMCIEAANLGIKTIILPEQNSAEASIVSNVDIIPAKNLVDVVAFINKAIKIEPVKTDVNKFLNSEHKSIYDFSEVKGQENVKRALEVAAAGGHNCLLIGNPGSGKTMISRRVPTILPDLTFEEALEITKIHSVAGVLPNNMPIINTRPFRAPHHTVSGVSLAGGGKIPKPGEISLAHYGILFLDELPEFNKHTLEVLRGPLEDREVTISRVNGTHTYPANFMLIASMNPCPCGYYGSKTKECTCSPQAISNYMGKISGPLLDRIDICVEVNDVEYNKLNEHGPIESSEIVRKRVNMARKIQTERYKKYSIFSNSELTPKLMEHFCFLDEKCQGILKNAFEKLKLSARAYGRILKLARTIADLDNKDKIEVNNIAEAIQYRSIDKKYWRN